MLIAKLYQQFLKHTELVDSTYKSVFIQISTVLEQISVVKFKSLSYTVGDKQVLWDFTTTNDVPNYVVEIVRNLFEQFYTLPQSSDVELTVKYEDTDLVVSARGDKFIIPDELEFIRQYSLCSYFINDHLVYEPFDDFERYFKFISTMCKENETPIRELQDLFKDANAPKDSIFSLESSNTDEINSVLISLKKSRKESIEKLSQVKLERENTFSLKLGSTPKVAERNSLLDNKLRVASDHSDIQKEKSAHLSRIQQTQNLLKQVEQELLSITQDSNEEDFSYLKDKKFNLSKALEVVQTNFAQISHIEGTYAKQLQSIDIELTEYSGYNDTSIGQIEADLLKQDETIMHLDNLIANYEAKIHDLYTQLNTTIKPEKHYEANTNIVVSKLSSIGYSRPITIVLNYIKNLYTYHVLSKTNEIVNAPEFEHYGDNKVIYAQTVAARLVLSDLFNLEFNNVFSSIPIGSKYYKHVVIIRRDV